MESSGNTLAVKARYSFKTDHAGSWSALQLSEVEAKDNAGTSKH